MDSSALQHFKESDGTRVLTHGPNCASSLEQFVHMLARRGTQGQSRNLRGECSRSFSFRNDTSSFQVRGRILCNYPSCYQTVRRRIGTPYRSLHPIHLCLGVLYSDGETFAYRYVYLGAIVLLVQVQSQLLLRHVGVGGHGTDVLDVLDRASQTSCEQT